MLSISDVLSAQQRVSGCVHVTPIMTSQTINQLTGCQVFFKCEHLQKTGSFKARGACNSVRKIVEEGKAKGVVTHSSGNHGCALAWAAKKFEIPCTVVVPKNTPSSKVQGIEAYGAAVERCEPTMKSRQETCEQLAEKLDYGIVPPFDDHAIMAGQATVAVDIFSQVPDVDAIFVAVGGGGLAAGVTTYVKETKPDVEVYLVQPEGKGLDLYLKNGECRTDIDALTTVADGIRTLKVGASPFNVLQKYCRDKVITVSDDEIREGMRLIWTRLKQRVEPTAGVPMAGLLKLQRETNSLNGKKVAIVL